MKLVRSVALIPCDIVGHVLPQHRIVMRILAKSQLGGVSPNNNLTAQISIRAFAGKIDKWVSIPNPP